jgi:hypothetical protein
MLLSFLYISAVSTYTQCDTCVLRTLDSWRIQLQKPSVELTAVAYRGGGEGLGFQPPPPHEIPKALQNHAKLNLIVKTVKNYWI